jgi:hypothetical protein
MHPNAGAQLRAELRLLPDILLNPTYGSDNLLDPNVHSSVPTNASQGLFGDVLNAGENLEENDVGMGAHSGDQGDNGGLYRMCSLIGSTATGVRSQVDPFGGESAAIGGSISTPATQGMGAGLDTAAVAGSSAPTSPETSGSRVYWATLRSVHRHCFF